MTRPSRDKYFMEMAALISTRTTCIRRAVGCVLVSVRGHVLSTGYNGVAAGRSHCNEHDPFHETGFPHACIAAFVPSGQRVDECEAIHAEQNALVQCRDVWQIDTCYCTTFPCPSCVKLLLGTACRRIVYAEDYPARMQAESLWLDANREVTKWETR